MRDTSLVYPIREDGAILLGRKRRGMGVGKWNGFGGKIEDGETMAACAVRELFEECGLAADVAALSFVADLYFDLPSDPAWSHGGAVYFVHAWTGEAQATDEMEPRWFWPKDLPYDEMWEADRIWLPRLLSGERLRGTVRFAADGEHVTETELESL